MKFDALTMINRLKNEFNINDPSTIMCPKEMPYKNAYYYEDTRAAAIELKGDNFTTSSYTNWIDQMIVYANLRITMGKKESYSLDSVATEEIGHTKIPFEGNETIKNIPWINYKKFFKYNVVDVFLLHLIEEKVGDIDLMYNTAMMTRTRVDKAMRKTISLRNLGNDFYRSNGLIMSNNRNKTYGGSMGKSEKYRGAYVSEPLLNELVGMLINGKPSRHIFRDVIDVDLSSLYPSILIAFNIDVSTQVGKVNFYEDDSEDAENKAPELFDALQAQDWVMYGEKYFDLPNEEDLIDEFEELLCA